MYVTFYGKLVSRAVLKILFTFLLYLRCAGDAVNYMTQFNSSETLTGQFLKLNEMV